jgi:hypothetical protein
MSFFRESLITFKIKFKENGEEIIDEYFMARGEILGFVEKKNEGTCIITTRGLYLLGTPKENVIAQIERYDNLRELYEKERSKGTAQITMKELKKLLDESEKDRLFGSEEE